MELHVRLFSKLFLILILLELIGFLDAILSKHIGNNSVGHRDSQEIYSIRSPYNYNEATRFVKLALVVDYDLYENIGREIERIKTRYKTLTRVTSSLFQPFNIVVTLVELEICNKFPKDRTTFDTFKECSNYAHKFLNVADHVILITTRLVGNDFLGFMCDSSSISAIQDIPKKYDVAYEARNLARVLAFTMEINMDADECCPSKSCIMSNIPDKRIGNPEWSHCSIASLKLIATNRQSLPCLNNKPTKLFEGPVCGNSFIEAEEECDCGQKNICDDPCCNATTCKFKHESCTDGECCDIQNCRLYNTNTLCRPASGACDRVEYCNGKSHHCPADNFKNYGENCSKGLECEHLKPICDEGTAICPNYGKDNGNCDAEGHCQCNVTIFSQCYCPDDQQLDLSDAYDLLLRVVLLAVALLFLFFLFDVVIRRCRSCCQHQNQSTVVHPYCSRPIDDMVLPPPRDAFYNRPIDDVDFQRTTNASYAQPVNSLNFRPTAPLPSLPEAMNDTELAKYQCQNEYASIAEYTEPRYQVIRRYNPQK